MAALAGNFTDHSVFIYDADGNHLINTTVTNHDRDAKQMQVSIMPNELKVNDNCKLLVLASPTPCEFQGKVKKVGGNKFIAMFQGHEVENRGAARYSVNTAAVIYTFICDGQPYHLHTPVKVVILNISTTGVRFRAPFYSFQKGDIFKMHLSINNSRKDLTAEVMNFIDNEPNSSDYGCRFVEVVT